MKLSFQDLLFCPDFTVGNSKKSGPVSGFKNFTKISLKRLYRSFMRSFIKNVFMYSYFGYKRYVVKLNFT